MKYNIKLKYAIIFTIFMFTSIYSFSGISGPDLVKYSQNHRLRQAKIRHQIQERNSKELIQILIEEDDKIKEYIKSNREVIKQQQQLILQLKRRIVKLEKELDIEFKPTFGESK